MIKCLKASPAGYATYSDWLAQNHLRRPERTERLAPRLLTKERLKDSFQNISDTFYARLCLSSIVVLCLSLLVLKTGNLSYRAIPDRTTIASERTNSSLCHTHTAIHGPPLERLVLDA